MNFKNLSVLFLLFTLYVIPVNAQKCKYQFDKEDPITGERIRRNIHNINMWTKLAFYRANDDTRVELNFVKGGEQNFAIPVGTEIIIKTGDGKLLKLKSANKAMPQSFVTGNQVATAYAISYFISKEQMQQIADNGIKFIKAMILDDLSVDYEIKKGKNKKIMKSAFCMLQD